MSPPSPLSKEDDESDDGKPNPEQVSDNDIGDFFGDILKQRNLDTEVDDDDTKKIDKSNMQMIMSNSIMQSVVVQSGGNENFEEDEDELDIFAESNKKEPMRNPILGGGGN